MATILGPRALIDIAVPTGVDASEVLKFSLEDGVSAAEVIAEAAATIGVINEQLIQRYGGLIYLTEKVYTRYRQGEGSRTMTPRNAEFGTPDGSRSDNIGHMLPRWDYIDATSWSEEWLRRAPREDVMDDLRLIGERWMSRVDYDILNRMFTNTENQIGSSGYDVPWAIGTGMNVNYIPPAYRGYQFSSSHTHFVLKAATKSSANYALLLEDMVTQLRHHGYEGRLVALVSDSDLSTVRGMTDFVDLTPFTVVTGTTTGTPVQVVQGEVQGIPGELFGYYNSDRGVVELRYHERIPAGYCWMGKSFGVNDQRNGVGIRVEPGGGFGLRVDPQVTRSLQPRLEKLLFKATHGVGVWDRLNGVAGWVDAGASSWTNPTIS